MVFRDARGRVARALLELAEDFGRLEGMHLTIDLPLTQSELATFAGTTRQTVNASLRQFEREGVTTRERRRIVVLKREHLRRAASGSS
jgi:CRP-like cAMP-binding protein